MTGLRAEHINAAYATRPVLRDVTLHAAPGEMVGIIGPNGAGKSTLLRCLAGLGVCAGDIFYGTQKLSTLSTRARATCRAYVGQDIFAPWASTIEHVVSMGLAYGDALYRAPHLPDQVAEVLREVGCTQAPTRRLDQLSGGERQQVLVARALLQPAALFLLDEPMSALDLRHRAALVLALRRRARAGAAVVLSLHDLNLAAVVCDRLVLLSEGRVVAAGAPRDVLQKERLEAVYAVALRVRAQGDGGIPNVELDLFDKHVF